MKQLIIFYTFVLISFDMHAQSKLIEKDAFLFRILNSVISLNEARHDFYLLQEFECIYPESLLVKIFEELKDQANKNNLNSMDSSLLSFSEGQKDMFRNFINFYKLRAYIETHSVVVNSTLVTAFYASGKKNNCKLIGYENSKKFTDRFEFIVKMEIFLRSRFINVENDKLNSELFKKATESAKLFIDSVSKQVTEEVFW